MAGFEFTPDNHSKDHHTSQSCHHVTMYVCDIAGEIDMCAEKSIKHKRNVYVNELSYSPKSQSTVDDVLLSLDSRGNNYS